MFQVEQKPHTQKARLHPWPGFHPLGFIIGLTILANAFVHDCTWRSWSDPELVFGLEAVPIASSPADLDAFLTGRPNLTYTVSKRTRVKKVGSQGQAIEVQILEGRHAGDRGWVCSDWIK